MVRTRTTPRTRTAAVQVTALAAASALALSACGGGTTASADAAPVATDRDIELSLVWWGDDDRASRYEEAVALFEEKYPNIDVQTQFQAWDDYWTARSTEAAGQTLPDVFQMDLAYIHQYASNNQLLDLSNQVGVNLDTAGYDEALLASGAVNGGQFGIPTSTNTLGMIRHDDLLDELGIDPPAEGLTWDEYDAWIREVSEAGADHDPQVYGGTDYTGTLWLFIQWLLQQGKTAFDDDGTPAFTKDDLVAWVERTQPLRDDGVFYPVQRAKQVEPLTGLQVNEAATELTWDNMMAGYSASAGTENVDLLPVPTGADGSQQFWKPSMLLSSSASTQEPDAAAALIDFLVNDPEVGAIFGTSKGVPAVVGQRDAMEIEEGSVDGKIVGYEDAVAERVTADTPLPAEGYGVVEVEFKRLGEELSYGNITPEEFADQWFQSAEANLGGA
ncbi:ABC transporter substrate-binding protein [Promicromonospora thailandica]|uniref:Multiple sugar transport system substrate-binding protein n=1 Tax=Promicromonospora thailandica TaxID=765201 RepID=A0A9X2G0P9_9MICO|nr:ABC transporter substrate-binding protein [Promicromonospora thailandica]MCP2263573.1 multiple sugar transport system substrate-binding protein [Promicromonospora thailandica]BFF19238.1 extracellular solute-binding protein [Promicromonospora thailandica]